MGVKNIEVRREYLILAAIFLLVLGARLYFSLQTHEFSSSESYFNLRQVESIRKTGLPIFNDRLSYSGRFYIFLPLFHYIIALFSLVLPTWLASKLVSGIMLSSLVIIVYLLAKELTKETESALIAAAISGFLPLLFYKTVTSLSVYSLVLPLSFGILLLFIRAKPELRSILLFMGAMLLMVLADQSVLALLLGFFIYLVLGWLVKLKYSMMDKELIYTSSLLVLFFSLMAFKNVLAEYGPEIARQNIPQSLISSYFQSFNIFEAIYQIGIIPFVFGIYVIYRHLLVEKNRELYVIISFALSLSVMIWLGLIQLSTGLIFFSVVLTILSAEAYRALSGYIGKTKFSRHYNLFLAGFIILIIFSALIPSVIYARQGISESVTKAEIDALEWMRNNTWEGTVVAGSPDSGHLITAIAERRNIMDTNFLMQANAEGRLSDLNTIYITKFETEAVRLLNKYHAEYVLLSPLEQKSYPQPLSYIDGSSCFKLVYDGEAKIYKSLCVIEES